MKMLALKMLLEGSFVAIEFVKEKSVRAFRIVADVEEEAVSFQAQGILGLGPQSCGKV